ncbi:MAG: LacI family DNA-binding transcriptional regulator [Christensenellales bacterium]
MFMKDNRITIRDVARQANVSTATVSRYLNKTGYVGADTGLRIAKAIKETNFSPSFVARGLKTQKSPIILLVVPDICNPFYSQMAKTAQQLVSTRGFVLALFDSNGEGDREIAAAQLARQMYASGILFASIDAKQAIIHALLESKLPVVGLNAYDECPFDVVHVHKAGGTYLSTNHLIDLGHQNIAFAGGQPGTMIARSRLQGYERAMREANLAFGEEHIFEMGFSHQDGYKAGCYFSTLSPRPTAICCANDLIALGIISALNEFGMQVPSDVSVTGMDDIPYSQTASPRLTTVTNDSDTFAREGVRMLFERIDGAYEGDPRQYEIPNELILRASTRQFKSETESTD